MLIYPYEPMTIALSEIFLTNLIDGIKRQKA